MLELKRILWNRKTLLLFGILILLHGVFFFFQCNEEKVITPTGEELAEYVDGYAAYIESVHENVAMMKENPLFRETNSFVYRNLIKTGEDYEKLSGIEPVVGENRGIVTVLNFNLTGFILLLIGVCIVLCFMAERQKGLYLLIRCTDRGRTQLSLQRIGILCFGILSAAALLYGSILCLATWAFPGCDMARPIQSIPEFESVIGHFSVGGYLVLSALRKALGCLFVCLLLYFCMSVFRSSFCVVAFFLLFVGEYLLYALIIPTGKWSAFKYINLYTYVFCGTEYANYYNLNIFGHPFNIVKSSDLLVMVGTLLLGGLCLYRYAVQYPRSEYRTLQFTEKVRMFVSRHKPSHTLMSWELKKVLFSQKGLVIFLLLFYLAYSASTESNYLDFRSQYVMHWYEEFAGEINEEKVTTIDDKKKEMEDKLEQLRETLQQQKQFLQERILAGKEEGTETTQKYIEYLEEEIRKIEPEIKGISVVLERAQEGLAVYQKTGFTIELIDTGVYELLFHGDKQTILRNYLYTLLTVVLMMSGIMACEKSSHMEMVLNSFYKGRMQILLRKIAIMIGVCVTCTLSIHIVQYIQIGKVFEYVNKDVLVQSVPRVRDFPIPLTIGQYIYFLYTVRTLISAMMGGVVMCLSNKFGRITTIALGVFLLIIPMGLVAMRF